ncbi:tRNA (adenosine(37)-N6)-dimethylallyltransferase MiaA [Dictyobacter arantiisoli]|uniref:tRNA dimethylallyltransferase n=1 Tax=Dictyobacter arantiisoli TaxID=2014874 RepID=A0A5A5T653_9CHLR|nr:tRNA (adenosine(37)-N6)-dimethylallyltransferase MiaA [Dictyobacter arantiisoli]GCF06848.1 tRNA dimethylallyltransferase [Dictyobacter arantiisoli]
MGNKTGEQPDLIVVLGPTASGKSALGITLAQRFAGEIVSADSRQVYRGLDIGTAKVTPVEQALIPHHLLDIVEPLEIYGVAQFQQDAVAAIDMIIQGGRLPLLVGGSYHYIQTVINHFDIPAVPPQLELRARLEALPLPQLLAQLEELDPQSMKTIDQQNPRRVIRALEVCLVTGQPFSQQRGISHPLYRCLLLGIQWPRPFLYQRIDSRIDERMQAGLVEEVQTLLERGISHERLDALGLEYRFVSRWLRGEYPSEAEMVQRLKYASHDFTRRQLSWFRREPRIVWLDGEVDLVAHATQAVQNFLQPTPTHP